MLIKPCDAFLTFNIRQHGLSLVELIVFIVVVSIAGTIFFKSYNYSARHNADPLIHVRALEAAQSKLDEILALKYDAQTPTGGVPACNSTDTGATVCDNTPDGDMNDVDDFNGVSDTPYTGYTRSVTVTTITVATPNDEKLITVTVTGPQSTSIKLAAYRANF